MAYDPLTDFLALLRQSADGVGFERMPGIDYVVSAMARAGMFRLSVGQTPPTSNQQSTVWFKPSVPSWVTEGIVYLWDASTAAYAIATPALWRTLLAPGGYFFQSVTSASGVVPIGTTVLAVQRIAPANTALVLPSLSAQWLSGSDLKIVDWSTSIINHTITLATTDGSTIMKQSSWGLRSTPDQLAGITLTPVPDLDGWIIAP